MFVCDCISVCMTTWLQCGRIKAGALLSCRQHFKMSLLIKSHYMNGGDARPYSSVSEQLFCWCLVNELSLQSTSTDALCYKPNPPQGPEQICTSVWGGDLAILKTAKTQIPHGVREPKTKTQIVFILLPSPVSPDSPLMSLCVLNTKQAPTDIMTCTTIQRSHLTIWAYWPTSSHTRETNIDMLLSQQCYLTLVQLPYGLVSWTQLYVHITSCGLMQPKWALKLHWLKRQDQIYNNKTAKSSNGKGKPKDLRSNQSTNLLVNLTANVTLLNHEKKGHKNFIDTSDK